MIIDVNRTDYLMLGFDLGTADFDFESEADEAEFKAKFEAEFSGAPGRRFDIVYDEPLDEYCMVGKIIAKSDPDTGIVMTKIEPDELDIDRTALAAAVSSAFGRAVSADDFSLVLFSHFS